MCRKSLCLSCFILFPERLFSCNWAKNQNRRCKPFGCRGWRSQRELFLDSEHWWWRPNKLQLWRNWHGCKGFRERNIKNFQQFHGNSLVYWVVRGRGSLEKERSNLSCTFYGWRVFVLRSTFRFCPRYVQREHSPQPKSPTMKLNCFKHNPTGLLDSKIRRCFHSYFLFLLLGKTVRID